MAKKRRDKTDNKDDSKLFAFLAVLLSVLGFVIALLAKRENKYVMFYAKQSLILFLTGIAAKILTLLLAITIVGLLAVPFVWIIYVVLFIIALVNSLSGKEKETPIVGKYARKIKL
ncbi:MAG: DUF4870 domain-containing protein [Nanoarchaeota archaeon]